MSDRISDVRWPEKTRDIRNHHFDSRIWDMFETRDDDIFICTYGKSGTTWMQQIVSQLLFSGREGLEVAEMSPCIEHRVPPAALKLAQLEAQTHRRFIKSHMPVDAIAFSHRAKYICVARDGRDVAWSWYNHHINANDTWYRTINDTPGREGPPMPKPKSSVREYFLEWLRNDGYPFWPFWSYIRSWWNVRMLPNVMMLHFEELRRDLEGQIRDIANFLEVDVESAAWPAILEHCSFSYMRENSTKSLPFGGKFWDDGSKAFIHKGTNGRWRDVLSDLDVEEYECTAIRELGPQCADWLETGDRSLLALS